MTRRAAWVPFTNPGAWGPAGHSKKRCEVESRRLEPLVWWPSQDDAHREPMNHDHRAAQRSVALNTAVTVYKKLGTAQELTSTVLIAMLGKAFYDANQSFSRSQFKSEKQGPWVASVNLMPLCSAFHSIIFTFASTLSVTSQPIHRA